MPANYAGPYSIGGETLDDGRTIIWRHNDGSLTIMGLDADGEPVPVLHVPMRARFKRGEAWKTTDPEQEAFARALVNIMNAADWSDCR